MAAPAGYKTFAAGAVLSATSDMQVFLMDQVCTVWNDASARTSGLATPAEGQVSYLKDTNAVEVYDGTSWVAVASSFSWTGSTANGLATYGSSTTVVAESTATYDGTTLELTQSGGGLKMDGLASSNANTLDDYEEGTFVGALTSATGSITLSSSYDNLTYTKVGRLVTITGTLEGSSVSSPNGAVSLGLPFTAANLGERASRVGFHIRVGGMVSANDNLFGYINENTATAYLNYGNGATNSGGAWMGGQIDGGTFFQFSFTYIAAT